MSHNEKASTPELQQSVRKLSVSSQPEQQRLRTSSDGATIKKEYVGDAMDAHLLTLGLVKKAMPKDDMTSIFRAVCEQISSVQSDHKTLRSLVENILRPIAQRFYSEAKDRAETNYDRDREILKILSDITRSRIKVFSLSSEPTVYEGAEVGHEISVCASKQYRSVFEPVYPMEIHEALAISQSIVYRTLYEGVFKVTKECVKESVQYIKEDIFCHTHMHESESWTDGHEHVHSTKAPCNHKKPRFPFCVCKSFDPCIYRNVDYDLYKKQRDSKKQAQLNSQAVKFSLGARCLIRDGGMTRSGTVVNVLSAEMRRIYFDDPLGSMRMRDYNVNDLRSPPSEPTPHHSMFTLMNSVNGGGRAGAMPPSLPYIPGCDPMAPMFNQPPPPSSPQFFTQQGGCGPMQPRFDPPQPLSSQQIYTQQGVPLGYLPAPFSPPMFMGGGPPPTQFVYQSSPVPPSSAGIGMSPAMMDTTLDNSVFSAATPLSTRKNEEEGRRGRESNKKPRALSMELADSPKPGGFAPTWNQSKRQGGGRGGEGYTRNTPRRVTEGDVGGEMPRPLQPKSQQLQHRLSTCSSVPENDSPSALPSVGNTPEQQMQQTEAVAAAAAAARKKIPELIPGLRFSTSSGEYTAGDDAVFEDGITNSQTSLAYDPQQLQQVQQMQLLEPLGGPPPSFYISIPYITREQYLQVNPKPPFSQCEDGSDLPDTLTTRAYYNLGLKFHLENLNNGERCPPPPGALPMPPTFAASPSMPPNSPFFFPNGQPAFTMPVMTPIQPAAPPCTPAINFPPGMAPAIAFQYANPGVEGMPQYVYIPNDPNMTGLPLLDQAMMLQQPQPMQPELQLQQVQQQQSQHPPTPSQMVDVTGTTHFFPRN